MRTSKIRFQNSTNDEMAILVILREWEGAISSLKVAKRGLPHTVRLNTPPFYATRLISRLIGLNQAQYSMYSIYDGPLFTVVQSRAALYRQTRKARGETLHW
jgi:DNA-binding transcriptional LysR family regulator